MDADVTDLPDFSPPSEEARLLLHAMWSRFEAMQEYVDVPMTLQALGAGVLVPQQLLGAKLWDLWFGGLSVSPSTIVPRQAVTFLQAALRRVAASFDAAQEESAAKQLQAEARQSLEQAQLEHRARKRARCPDPMGR